MKQIEYKRKFFIKDLFIPKRVINSFNCVEFESYDIFSYCIGNDLFLIKDNNFIFIPIKKMTDYENMAKLFNETNICIRTKLFLIIEDQELLDNILSTIVDKSFTILISKNLKMDFGKYWHTPNGKAWISKNKLVKEIKWDSQNFSEQINEMICIFNEEMVRFFLLDIDYKSFEGMKMEEIHNLKFWLYQLKNWMKIEKKTNPIELINSAFVKRVFVSDGLMLYMDKKKRADIWSFDLKKYIKYDGESMPMKELNLFRKYKDLVPNALYSDFKISNWFLIDYSQCKEIQGSLNEIPLIMGLINRWLYL